MFQSNKSLSLILLIALLCPSVGFPKTKKKPVAPQTLPAAPIAQPEEQKVAEVELQREQSKWYKLEGNYIGDLFENFSGGIKKGKAYLSLLSLRGTFDLENAIGWKGTSFFLHLQGEQGRKPSTFVGDSQVTSNIETPVDTGRVYEAWIQKSFEDGKFTALLGLYDLNSEFYTNAPAALFLNSSLGIGKELAQTGQNGPSIFPVTSVALRLKAQPTNEYYLQAVVLDAVAGDPKNPYGTHVILKPNEGYLIVNEVGWTPTTGTGKDEAPVGKVALGTWFYTETQEHLTQTDSGGGPLQATNAGTYLLMDHTVGKGFSVFARYGQANESVNPFKSDLSVGVYGKGVIASRADDEVGLTMTQVQLSKYFKEAQVVAGTPMRADETTYELTYKINFNDRFALQPDLQYVVHPSADPALDDSLSGTLRLKFSF